MLYESERSQPPTIDCSRGAAVVEKVLVHLTYPNMVVDQWGNEGTWTMVYNQVLEPPSSSPGLRGDGARPLLLRLLRLHPGRRGEGRPPGHLAAQVVTSFCNRTVPGQGWSHDVTVRNWACFSGRKVANI